MWNLVGFQTRLKIPDQQRVFRMIPGLGAAEFLRFGSIHRNAYVNSPRALTAHLSAKDDPLLLFAGQLTGVEGYTESAATGILAGINLARLLAAEQPRVPAPGERSGEHTPELQSPCQVLCRLLLDKKRLLEPLATPLKDKSRK